MSSEPTRVNVRARHGNGAVLFEATASASVLQEMLRIASSMTDNYVRASVPGDPPLVIEVKRVE